MQLYQNSSTLSITNPGPREDLLRATHIHDDLVDRSGAFDQHSRQAFKTFSKYIREFLINNPRASANQLRALANELLIYWNESIKPDTELFWAELKRNNIEFERKEPLRFALAKERFRTVEQGIDARNHWAVLKTQNSVAAHFTKFEIEKIDNIIIADEKKRAGILKKCLHKKAISQSQYLNFGDCMAYFTSCNLFDKYFTSDDVEELHEIWKNFKSK